MGKKMKSRSEEELKGLLRSRPEGFNQTKAEDQKKLFSYFSELVESLSDSDLKGILELTHSQWRHQVILKEYARRSRHNKT